MAEAKQRAVSLATPESVCSTVITTIADAKGVEPTALSEQLNDVIDPDALERIFQDSATGPARTAGRVCFEMAGCDVEVHATGRVSVTESARGREAQDWVAIPSSSRSNELAELDG